MGCMESLRDNLYVGTEHFSGGFWTLVNSELKFTIHDDPSLRNNLTRLPMKICFFLIKVSEGAADSSSSPTSASWTSNNVAPAAAEEIMVAHHNKLMWRHIWFFKTKGNTGHWDPVVIMYCSSIYGIIYPECIYPGCFILCGIQHHLKASQAKVWHSILGLSTTPPLRPDLKKKVCKLKAMLSAISRFLHAHTRYNF